MERPIRILTAKVGLDGHDRGIKVIASALRDAGMEVIYTGLHQTPEMIVNAALEEDVDGICVSLLSGAHMTLFPKILNLMKEKGMDDVILFGGGIIPPEDASKLNEMGVKGLFGPGSDTRLIVDYVRGEIGKKRRLLHKFNGGAAPDVSRKEHKGIS
jgi:methylmalonyl-CoA mutase C-terminal domain/subunit